MENPHISLYEAVKDRKDADGLGKCLDGSRRVINTVNMPAGKAQANRK